MRSPWGISLGRQGLDWSNQSGSSSGLSTGIHSLKARHGGRGGAMVSTSKGGGGGRVFRRDRATIERRAGSWLKELALASREKDFDFHRHLEALREA